MLGRIGSELFQFDEVRLSRSVLRFQSQRFQVKLLRFLQLARQMQNRPEIHVCGGRLNGKSKTLVSLASVIRSFASFRPLWEQREERGLKLFPS